MNDRPPTLVAARREFRHAFSQFILTLAYSLKVDYMINFTSRLIEAAVSVYSGFFPAYAERIARFESHRMLTELVSVTKDQGLSTQINYLIEEKARSIASSGSDSHSSVLEDLRHEVRRRLSVLSPSDVIVWLEKVTTVEDLENAQFATYSDMTERGHAL